MVLLIEGHHNTPHAPLTVCIFLKYPKILPRECVLGYRAVKGINPCVCRRGLTANMSPEATSISFHRIMTFYDAPQRVTPNPIKGPGFTEWSTCRSSRIVNVSSSAHQFGSMDFEDLQSSRGYQPWKAYGQSKLANLLFTYELARRLPVSANTTVNALHPGVVNTELAR